MLHRQTLRIIGRRWHWAAAAALLALVSQELWLRRSAAARYAAASIVRVVVPPADALPAGEELWSDSALAAAAAGQGVFALAARMLRGDIPWEDRARLPPPIAAEVPAVLERYGDPGPKTATAAPGRTSDLTSVVAAALRERVTIQPAGDGLYRIEGRGSSEAEAVIVSVAVASAMRDHVRETLAARVEARIEDLRRRRDRLEEERDAALAEEIETARRLGMSDTSSRAALLRRLLSETEADLERARLRRDELASRIGRRDLERLRVEIDPRAASGSVTGSDRVPAPEGGLFDRSSARPPPGAGREEAGPGGDGGGARIDADLAAARLDLEVQRSALPPGHPRVARAARRVRELEARAARRRDSRDAAPPAPPRADAEKDLAREYRSVIARIEDLDRRREELFASLARLREIGPALSSVEDRLSRATRAVERVREALIAARAALASGPARAAVEEAPWGARPLSDPAGRWVWRAAIAAGAAGVALALAIAAGRLDTRVYSPRDVRLVLDLPVIATIPRLGRRERRPAAGLPSGGATERFGACAAVIHSVATEVGMRVIAVAGADIGEGRSTVAAHLAVALARNGLRVALVDASLRNPSVHRLLGCSCDAGITTLLERDESTQEIVTGDTFDALEGTDDGEIDVVECLQETAFDNLFVLPAGPAGKAGSATVEGARVRRVLQELGDIMDLVVVDTPAALEGGEAASLVSMADGCLLVVASGRCESADVLWVKSLIDNVQTGTIGVVLNRCSKGAMKEPALAVDEHRRCRVAVEV